MTDVLQQQLCLVIWWLCKIHIVQQSKLWWKHGGPHIKKKKNNLNVVLQVQKCGWANRHSASVTVFPLLSQSFAVCHIHIGHMLEKLTVQHPFSDSSHLSNRQTKQNATLEPYRFHKLMETFIPHSQPQWKCLPSMEKSVCQCVVQWCLGLQISTERRR